jgi:hypothetical protein
MKIRNRPNMNSAHRKHVTLKKTLLKRVAIFIALPSFALLALPSCSKVLSHRTDEQAWMEFDKEARISRVPAAFVDTDSPGLTALHENLTNIPVRTLLLKCGNAANIATCYQSALTLQFDESFTAAQTKFSELKPTDYKREQKSFFAFRAYETVFDEVNRFHQSILSGLDLKARAHAEDFFKGCENEAQKEAVIEDFSVLANITSEMPKGTYSCLREHWFSDQHALLEETTDRLGLSIVSLEARDWIRDQQIAPIYEAEIEAVATKKAKAELEQFHHEKAEVFAGFDAKLPQDKLLKDWSAKLRERYPYSPVEQWIVSFAKEQR